MLYLTWTFQTQLDSIHNYCKFLHQLSVKFLLALYLNLHSIIFEQLVLFPVEGSFQIALEASAEEFASPDQGGMSIHIS